MSTPPTSEHARALPTLTAAEAPRFDPRVPFAYTLHSTTMRERPLRPARIVCEVDGSQEARDAVRAAIALCRDQHADLELVGIIPAGRNPGRPRPRDWLFREIEGALTDALAAAHEAGVRATVPTLISLARTSQRPSATR